MSRFLNRLLALALLCFAVASHYGLRPEGATPPDAPRASKPEHRAASAKADPPLALQEAAGASLAKEAKEHCLAHVRDCLALLQKIAADAALKKRLLDEGRAPND